MYARIGANIALALVATFMLVASLVFSSAQVGWSMIAFALLVLATVVGAGRGRALAEHVVDALMALLALWALAASLAFSGTTLMWLCFAEAVGFVVLALAGVASSTVVAIVTNSAEPQTAKSEVVAGPLGRHPEGLGTAA